MVMRDCRCVRMMEYGAERIPFAKKYAGEKCPEMLRGPERLWKK